MKSFMSQVGLVEQAVFFEILDELDRIGSKKPILLALLDVDASKTIPAEAQEFYFTTVSHKIAESIPDAIISRIGRDCYAVLFIDTKKSYFDMANIKGTLQTSICLEPHPILTFCMGMTAYPSSCNQISEIFAVASEALFAAKKNGTNQIEIPSEQPMKMKACYFRQGQLEKLNAVSKKIKKPESFILRKALDEYLKKIETTY